MVRSAKPPSRSASSNPGPRTKRARAALKSAQPKTQGSQMGYKSSTLSLAKPMSRGAMAAKLAQSTLETVILRWNGVKDFNTRGFYWMQNRTCIAC